ncbi:MAG: RNA 3'-terminal phosphate cyclase [Desulfobaccales bacterium]
MLYLDGSYGEGGGQIVRTSLSLAALVGEAVRIENIRAGRPKPGLKAQHLTAVKALARISGAEVKGAELNSLELTFIPGRVQAGHYVFDVAETMGSAGSVSLVAQAILPALLFAPGKSTVIIKGGTHVPWSPPVHYLLHVFLPLLARLGAQVRLSLERWGFYPRGGGQVRLEVTPVTSLAPVELLTPATRGELQALSAAGRLPEHVRRRQAARLRERLGAGLPVAEAEADSLDPGSLVFLWGPGAGFSALGARGKPAEQVADEAVDAFLHYEARQAALDRHGADQLVLYLAQARGPSRFTTEAVTSHLLTNIWVIEQFLGPRFTVTGSLGERGEVLCRGAS